MMNKAKVKEGPVTPREFDVVIAGAGMAGLTLGRQLMLRMPKLRVLNIDRLQRPLPDAALKVGESTLSAGGYYLQHVIKLYDYLLTRQMCKFGLRYFFPDRSVPFEARPEFGMSRVHSTSLSPMGLPEWQIDRGRFENDLRAMNQEAGVTLLEGWRLVDAHLGNPFHEVLAEDPETHEVVSFRTSWFIDALGSRGFLKRKLGLQKPLDLPPHGACWFRVKGRIDVSHCGDPTNREWMERTEGKHPHIADHGRYYSTNHLMGDGYWVWVIPLSSGATSVGVAVQETVEPFKPFTELRTTLEWIEEREPELARLLRGREVLDFKNLRNFTYSSKQVISADRWACTGISGCFADPFYSPGNDSIAFMNCLITDAIEVQRRGKFTEQVAEEVNREFIDWIELYTRVIQEAYPYFGRALVTTMKIMWDTGIGQSTNHPLFFNLRFKPGYVLKRYRLMRMSRWLQRQAFLKRLLGRLIPDVPAFYERGLSLNTRMRAFFQEWGKKTPGRLTFDFLELLDDNPVVKENYEKTHSATQAPFTIISEGLWRMERMALAYFLIAIEDVMPEMLDRFLDAPALNPRAISLDPSRWEADGLFTPMVAMDKPLSYYHELRPKLKMAPAKEKREPELVLQGGGVGA